MSRPIQGKGSFDIGWFKGSVVGPTPEGHDEQCEAEFIEGPMAYTACRCDERAEVSGQSETHERDKAVQAPEAAPAVVMDQRGNYWRAYPDGNLSICPTTTDNYQSEPIAIYRQGRELSAKDMHDLLARVESSTDDPLLLRAARSALHAYVTGRDMVTEAELLMQGVAVRLAASGATA